MNLKVIVVVCIHDRYENLKRWIHAWNMCEKNGDKLFFVHNIDKDVDTSEWKKYCEDRGVGYIKRENIGFETAVIQDVIMQRMLAEEKWDLYLSCTDDTLPMKKDFLRYYAVEMSKPGVGVACMEVSGVYTPHVRTTGWCIDRHTADYVEFPANQITTKEECYHFEHMGGEETLMSQVLRMGKLVVQLSPLKTSVMWDTHHHEDFNRWKEWNKEFPGYLN